MDKDKIFETLTESQKDMVKHGFNFIINEDGKMECIEPEKIPQKYIEIFSSEIKKKYSKIILSEYSLTDQLNMSNEALLITSTAQAESRDFTQSEIEILNKIKDAKLWIDEKRQECQEEILALNKKKEDG